MQINHNYLHLRYIGIDTYREPVIYMRKDCHICHSEGLEVQARVAVTLNNRSIIATFNSIETDLLHHHEAGLSSVIVEKIKQHQGINL